MTIVYCGDLWHGSTCRMRIDALRTAGHEVVEVDTTYDPCSVLGLAARALKKLRCSVDPSRANEGLLTSVARDKPELVWIDKGLCITPRTLQTIRAMLPTIQIVHYSPDDMGGRHNQSRPYLESVSLYDLHVTTKSFNVSELTGVGARAVLFVNNAYCPGTHRPMNISPEDRRILGGTVGFIGGFERDRAEALLFLLNHGVPVRIWGGGWERWAEGNGYPDTLVGGHCLWGEEYAKAICSFDINLGFLRKLNRDLQTTRSVEIPACGSFMLAERTSEHLGLFSEGVEAEFFSSNDELLEKCCYYLAHSEQRTNIADAGRERCLRSGYSYNRHVEAVLDRLRRLRTGGDDFASRA